MMGAYSLGPLPEVCDKCRRPMLDGAEHHSCQPTREELEVEIERLRASLAAAQAEREEAVQRADRAICALADLEGAAEEALVCMQDERPDWPATQMLSSALARAIARNP